MKSNSLDSVHTVIKTIACAEHNTKASSTKTFLLIEICQISVQWKNRCIQLRKKSLTASIHNDILRSTLRCNYLSRYFNNFLTCYKITRTTRKNSPANNWNAINIKTLLTEHDAAKSLANKINRSTDVHYITIQNFQTSMYSLCHLPTSVYSLCSRWN